MASFNKTILMGNLTRDPEMRYLANQMAVVDFGIAVNHKYKTKAGEDREDVLFIDVSAFGKTGEVINQHFTKGKPILIEGRLRYETWDDKNGGGKRSKHSITLDSFAFVGSKNDGGEQPPQQRTTPSRGGFGGAFGGGRPQRQTQPEPPFHETTEFTDDSIPFRWDGRRGQAI